MLLPTCSPGTISSTWSRFVAPVAAICSAVITVVSAGAEPIGWGVAVAWCAGIWASWSAQGTTQMLVGSGVPAPDGNGILTFLGDPVLNNNGRVAFPATATGTSGGGDDDG